MVVAVIRIPRPSEDEGAQIIEQRFATQLKSVSQAPGFVGFQLLRPSRGSDQYLSISTWESMDALVAWANSTYNAQVHGRHGAGTAMTADTLPSSVEVYEVAVSAPEATS